MANLFKRAAQAFGRITGRRSRVETDVAQMPLIESVGLTDDTAVHAEAPAVEPIDELIEKSGALPALDSSIDSSTPWEEILTTPNPTTASVDASVTTESAETTTPIDEGLAVTASLYEAQATEVAATEVVTATSSEETTSEVVVAATTVEADETPTVTALEIPVTETVVTPEAFIPEPVAPAPIVEDFKAPIEMKPDPAQASLDTLADLYDLISVEVDKRTENTAAVYERLLAATREDLESARRSNRIAWSVGGVMTAVAAFGAIWSSGEVSATHTELTALKQQVNAGQLASAERDSLRSELFKVKETFAKVEIDQLKARLDQALTVSAERDRLHTELDRVKRDRQELDTELRLARAAATTQPVSDARKFLEQTAAAHTTVASSKADRPDVWSVLLNGRD